MTPPPERVSNEVEVQIEQRKANLEAITRLGFPRYPNKFDTTHTVSELVAAHGARPPRSSRPRVETVDGRAGSSASAASARRASSCCPTGARAFQVYVRQDALSERDYRLSKLLDFGDQIGVAGHLFRTKTNELSIWASSLEFLAKCFLPLPEKWHGLQDVEIRYRQRYLDLIVNPDVRRVFEIRSRTVIGDPRVPRRARLPRGRDADDAADRRRRAGAAVRDASQRARHEALPAHRARAVPQAAVVGGIERVFEINRNFRNEGISTQHNPEFTMLEFYWAYADYQRLMALTEELLSTVATRARDRRRCRSASTRSPSGAVRALSQGRCRARRRRSGSARAVTVEELRSLQRAARAGARSSASRSRRVGAGKIASAIFEALWEENLVQPTFVYDYPTEVSPLSKQRPDDPDTVERFELYIGGFEVANAFSELNDPVEQRRRFEAQLADRAAATTKRTRWTRTTSARSNTVCRRGRRRHRHRSPGDAAHQLAVDPRRHPVPADAAARRREKGPSGTHREMPFELQVALRYLLAKRRQVFISVISLVSTLGVTVGVMALVIALALMTGLQSELRDRILGSSAHVFVWKPAASPTTGRGREGQRRCPGVIGGRAGADRQGHDHRRAATASSRVKGIDPRSSERHRHRRRDDRRVAGRLAPGDRGRAAGHRARQGPRRRIGAMVGDTVTLLTPSGSLSPMGVMPRQRRFKVVGTFRLGLYEFDSAYGFVDLEPPA